MRAINLLPNQSRIDFQRLKLVKKTRQIAFIFLSGFLTISLVIFAFLFYFSQQVKKNEASLNAARSEFSRFLPTIEEQQNLRFRVKLAAQILEGRPLVSEQVAWLKDFIGEGGTIDRLRVKAGGLEVSGIIDSYAYLEQLEEKARMEENKKDSRYKEITLGSLGQKTDGSWEFVMKLKK